MGCRSAGPFLLSVLLATLIGCSRDATSDAPGSTATMIATELGAPTAVIREEFTWPRNVVELADGRAIVNDPRDGDVYVVDFETGERTLFGRKGDGPGEYRSPAALLRHAGDSVVIVSGGPVPRVSVLTTGGAPVRSVTLDAARFPSEDPTMPDRSYTEWPSQVIATDRAGHLYGARPRLPASFDVVPDDYLKQSLVRFALDDHAIDSIVTIIPSGVISARPTASGVEYDLPLGPFEMSHAWTVFADGTAAVLDERTFELTLYPADAPAVDVGVVDHALPSPLTPDDWESFADSTRSAMLASMQGAPSMLAGPGGGPPPVTVLVPPMPATFPPVLADAERRLLPDGDHLWVPVPGADPLHRETWQVLDRDGRTVARYAFAKGTHLLAVTEHFLYTRAAHEDGLQQLQRFAR